MMRKPLYAALLSVAASAALLTAGCGGATTNNSTLRATPSSGPVIFGLNPVAINNAGTFVEESGLTNSTSAIGYATAASSYTNTGSGPLPTEQTSSGKIPFGFVPGNGGAAAPGSSVIFHAAISNGVSGTTGQVLAIVPASVVLTSPEIAGFTQPLTFTGVVAGSAYPNGTYGTAAFALPFTTTGLHMFVASVADAGGNTSATTFVVPVVKPADAGVTVQIVDANGALPGATATITNPITGAVSQATADSQGVVVLFAAPGVQTITATSTGTGASGANETGTATATLVAGQLIPTVTTGTGTTATTGTTLTVQ